MNTTISIDGASCRIWSDGPEWNGVVSGTIGELSFDSAETGAEVLRLATAMLSDMGVSMVLAPMCRDTWHAYRAVVESDGSSPFPLEPASGPHDVEALRLAGFDVVARYASARTNVRDETSSDVVVPGISIRAWDGRGADGLLDRLHSMAAGSFADKMFFRSIGRDEFLDLYRPMLAAIVPEMVLFALDETGAMAGFLFGYPDPASGAAVLKTYAGTRPGVGRMLARRFHDDAIARGHPCVVHALMHEDNVSLVRSGQHGGEVFRRYALYGRNARS